MSKSYKTSEVAQIMKVHPNTVRFYEEIKFIPKAKRLPNNYRIFTDFHLEQFKLAKIALEVEVLQNGIRKRAINIIKTSANGDFDEAINLTIKYMQLVNEEQRNAEEALTIVRQTLANENHHSEKKGIYLSRREVAKNLNISIDRLRNWELNGLLTVKRKQNGYRVYNTEDINQLKIIKSLRLANYSLAAILRLLDDLSKDPKVDIRESLNTPKSNDDLVTVYDELLTSLQYAKKNAEKILVHLKMMKEKFEIKPPA